jgi:hypothetical protein
LIALDNLLDMVATEAAEVGLERELEKRRGQRMQMKINALTVCVNYWDIYNRCFRRVLEGVDSLTIVTDLANFEALERHPDFGGGMNRNPKLKIVATDLFYADGCTFNKGRAMEWARVHHMTWEDWILFIDADICPQAGWRPILEHSHLKPGTLYSARRLDCKTPEDIDTGRARMITTDGVGVGYFQLFHVSDPHISGAPRPLLETFWKHAGVYDCAFMWKWKTDQSRQLLPVRLYHIGPRDNWLGRGNVAGFQKLQEERKAAGGSWQHERIAATPID